jgi:excisionase family DNA binding protein
MAIKLEDLISQKEAAEMRGVTIQAIDYLIKKERLRGIRVGGRTLVLREEVARYKPGRPGRPKKKPDSKPRQKSRKHR